MRIRNPHGRIVPWCEVDPRQPPSMVKDPHDPARDIYLNWSGAMDDKGHLRQCPVCGGQEFFARKDVPQVTAFVLILIAAAIAVKLYAVDQTLSAIIVLAAVVAVDLLIFFFTARQVVCYQCRSQFAGVPVAINQKSWEASTGERYRKLAQGTPRERSHTHGFLFLSPSLNRDGGQPDASSNAKTPAPPSAEASHQGGHDD